MLEELIKEPQRRSRAESEIFKTRIPHFRMYTWSLEYKKPITLGS